MISIKEDLIMTSVTEKLETFNETAWKGFKGSDWKKEINTRSFIQQNYTEYRGDDSFLQPAAPSTDKLWTKLQELFEKFSTEQSLF